MEITKEVMEEIREAIGGSSMEFMDGHEIIHDDGIVYVYTNGLFIPKVSDD